MSWLGAEELLPIDAPAEPELSFSPARRAAPAGQSLLCALFVVAAAALLGWTATKAYLYLPYSDMHDWVAEVFSTEKTGAWVRYLWLPHTEQRIPLARALTALDVEVAKGAAPTFLFATAAALAGGIAGLWALIWRAPLAGGVRVWTGCLASLLILNIAVAEDLAFPVFSVYLLVAGPALAAASLLQLAPSRRGVSISFVAALIFAALASLGNAAGLAIWPALLLAAARQHRGPLQIRVLLACAAACVIGIELGLGIPARMSGAGGGSPLAHLLKMAQYFTAFLALPWSRALGVPLLGSAVGLALLALTAGALTRRAEPANSPYAMLRGAGETLVVFGLLTAVLATLGRVDESATPIVPTRYFPFAGLLQAGLLLCWTPRIAPWLERRARLAPAVLASLALVGLGVQMRPAAFLLRTADRIRAVSAAFDRTGRFPASGLPLHSDPAKALRIRMAMKARGLPY